MMKENNTILIMVALLIISVAFFVYAWVKGKQEEERTITWIRDLE